MVVAAVVYRAIIVSTTIVKIATVVDLMMMGIIIARIILFVNFKSRKIRLDTIT
jgi:hypothetical protein